MPVGSARVPKFIEVKACVAIFPPPTVPMRVPTATALHRALLPSLSSSSLSSIRQLLLRHVRDSTERGRRETAHRVDSLFPGVRDYSFRHRVSLPMISDPERYKTAHHHRFSTSGVRLSLLYSDYILVCVRKTRLSRSRTEQRAAQARSAARPVMPSSSVPPRSAPRTTPLPSASGRPPPIAVAPPSAPRLSR